MSETLGDRLPDAIKRLERWIGSDAAMKLNREFHADLMAVLVAAKDTQKTTELCNQVAPAGRCMKCGHWTERVCYVCWVCYPPRVSDER